MKYGDLNIRMRCYEDASKVFLTRRLPIIIRLDGRSFHTFTRGMERPFDLNLMRIMQNTTHSLVKEVDGCVFGYTQSDEISLLLINYKTIDTQPWFDNNKSKIESITSSMATAYFNHLFHEDDERKRHVNIEVRSDKLAFFDSRAFVLPKEEVVNYFISRQQDATRNSIQMLGRSLYSQKQLHGKNCDQIQEMIFQSGQNWNDLEASKKRGTGVYKKQVSIDGNGMSPKHGDQFIRTEVVIDANTPIFTQNRNYIQRWVDVDKEPIIVIKG